jgi:hypothetical protein
MPTPSEKKAVAQLEVLARAEFGSLSPAEMKLIRNAPNGGRAQCGPSADPGACSNDPKNAGDWGPERVVRADMIRWLCVSREAKVLLDPKGVRLFGARVTGELNLNDAEVPFPILLVNCQLNAPARFSGCRIPLLSLEHSWASSIEAADSNFTQGVLLRDGFKTDGGITLARSQIGGDLDCTSGTFIIDDGNAVEASGVTIGGDANFDGSRIKGAIDLSGANVAGDVSFDRGEFINPRKTAISLERARIKGAIFFQADEHGSFKADGIVDLQGASAGGFADERPSWPAILALDGFVYDRIADGPSDAASRLDWLKLDNSGSNQPYRQLAKVLEDSGDAAGATQVRQALQARLSSNDWPPFRLLERSIGYGYQPQRALWGLAGLTALGALIYWRAHRMGTMTPTDKDAAQGAKSSPGLPGHYPRFQPFIFSLENTFPLVKLGQVDKWQPDPSHEPTISPDGVALKRFLARSPSPRVIRWFAWIQILLGWLFATLFVAAVSGIVQHG